MIRRHAFHAMGTEVECMLVGDEHDELGGPLSAVEAEFERLEALMSRFRPDSELARLNRQGLIRASPDLYRVVRLAIEARDRTAGAFDPTIHDALVAAGYDRTFEEIGAGRRGTAVALRPPRRSVGGRVRLDPEKRIVRLDPGVRLDLGGIAKGDAVDRACDLLESFGPCLVNAGGDLAVRGELDGGPWTVEVELADRKLTLGLRSGALASSGRDRRRWRCGGEDRHHLIDPFTGRPAETDLVRVTAFADSAAEAEVRAKTLVLAGERDAIARADAEAIPSVLVTADGRTVLAGGLLA